MPYGAPPPADGSNPYAGNPYAGQPAPQPAAPPPPPGYGYPAAPPPAPAQPGYGYPAPAAAQGPYAGQAYGYAPQGGPVCRFCGGFPAVETTVRGHQGIIIVMRFLKQPGPFCRTCGTAVVRDMSARTLVQGWWSYLSGLFTVITLLRNLAAHNKIKDLPPPVPGTHGPQLDPGVPLTKRPHMLMLLLPVISIGTMIALIATGAFLGSRHDRDPYRPLVLPEPTITVPTVPPLSPSFSLPPAIPLSPTPVPAPTVTMPTPTKEAGDIDSAKAGDCLRNENGTSATHDSNPRITMLPCTDPKAQYKVLKKVYATSDDDKACENVTGAESTYTRESTTPALSFVLCLKKL